MLLKHTKTDFAASYAIRNYSSQHEPRTIFSGIQPTAGVPHLGNYLGALQNWVKLQSSAERSDRLIFSLVDLHAITVPQKSQQLEQSKREMLASLLAIGLDSDRCILYEQSAVKEHTELAWILSTIAPLGSLSRMTQFKSKAKLISPTKDNPVQEEADPALDGLMLGLFAYPVLQAADILLYKTSLVPVGQDQSQHLELSRQLAKSINSRMSKKIFPLPKTLLSDSNSRVNNLRDPTKKMSKSATNEKSRISIIEDPSVIKSRISSALTDSISGISYDPQGRPGVTNLLDMYASFQITSSSGTMADIVEDVKDLSHAAFKSLVADTISEALRPIRGRYAALDIESVRGRQHLADVKARGAAKARTIAAATMVQVREHMGLS